MSKDDINGLRAQILANAKLMLKASSSLPLASRLESLPTDDTNATLIDLAAASPDPDIVIFGHGMQDKQDSMKFTAAIMIGLKPAIEGPETSSPELSLLKLLNTTCEVLNKYMPKVGSHQRNVHGGGVFDEDLISDQLIQAQSKGA